MPKYTDYKNREWNVVVDVTTLKRVERETGHLLTDMLVPTSETFNALRKKAFLFPDMLYAALKPQCDATGVTDEQFGEGLLGDAYAAAWEATVEAVVNFTQSPQQRDMLRQLLTKSRVAGELVIKQAAAAVETLTPETMAERVIAEASLSSVSNSPES